MAHGDYDCCAICDDKMYYAGFAATTKEEICDKCLKNLKDLNLNINNTEEFKKYINNGNYLEVKENLIKLGYEFCLYYNDLDKDVFYRFFRKDGRFKELIEQEENLKKGK